MADKSKMKCNVVTKSDRAGKKKMVKACSGGKEKLIHFGASGYGHNYSSAARKSFRARHRCDSAKDKMSARYWACKTLWSGPGGSTKSSPKNRQGKYQYICLIKINIMKHQGYNARLDESLGMRHGKKSQSFKARRDESKAMSKKMYGLSLIHI